MVQANPQSKALTVHNEKSQPCERTLVEAARVYGGQLEEVKLLIEKGAHVDMVNRFNRTALMEASDNGHEKIVELLIKKGANVNMVSNLGRTALMEASNHGHEKTVELLIEKRANVNMTDFLGSTALIEASRWNHIKIVELLIAKNADISQKDFFNRTALTGALIARSEASVQIDRLSEIIRLLESAAKEKSVVDPYTEKKVQKAVERVITKQKR